MPVSVCPRPPPTTSMNRFWFLSQSDRLMTVTHLVASSGVSSHVLIHPDRGVAPSRRPALSMNKFITGSQDYVACGVPGHSKIGGSSSLGVESADDEERSEAVVVEVAEAAGDASVEFDEAVDGFGAAVAGVVGVEVSEEFLAPLFGGAAEAGDLGDGAGVEGRDDAFGDGASVGEPGLVVGRAQLLGALVGDLDFDVFVASCQCGLEAGALALGEVFLTGAQDVTDRVKRVAFTAPASEGVVLDPAADLVDGGGSELDNMERVEDGAGVVEVVIDGVLVSVERVQGGDLHARAEILAAVFEPVAVGFTRSSGNEVKQPGPGTTLGIWGSGQPSRSALSGPARQLQQLGSRHDAKCARPHLSG